MDADATRVGFAARSMSAFADQLLIRYTDPANVHLLLVPQADTTKQQVQALLASAGSLSTSPCRYSGHSSRVPVTSPSSELRRRSRHVFDKHAAFRTELHRVERFCRKVNKHSGQMSPADGSRTTEQDHMLQHVAMAFEDIPEDMHESVRVILMHPTEDRSLRQQVTDVAVNAVGGGYGDLEEVTRRLTCLHMLTSLSTHSPYTYRIDEKVIRGSRPTPDKLRRLYEGGCRATINLCKEMPDGDDEIIREAELTGQMKTGHIEITDNTPPTPDQVIQLFTYLRELSGPVYVHCEAGVGRTGVMVACYRMFQGWGLADALCEAKKFGCAMPDQLAFIESRASAPTAGLVPPTEQPTEEVLSETATMNKDPMGLNRALASPATSLGSVADGSPGALTSQPPTSP
jgi:protein-tyrosine phosphatase